MSGRVYVVFLALYLTAIKHQYRDQVIKTQVIKR